MRFIFIAACLFNLRPCSRPRPHGPKTPTQFSVVNSSIQPAGLSPALAPASLAHTKEAQRRDSAAQDVPVGGKVVAV